MTPNTAIAESVLGDTWEQVRRILAEHVLPEEFDTWFEGITLLSCADGAARLSVPGNFRKDWIERSYGQLLTDAFSQVLGRHITIQILPRDTPEETTDTVSEESGFPPISSYQVLHSRYKFDNFVVGMSNKMAHAACLSVARSPSESYNPLFIYGGVGLGKTHLMQAIGYYVAEYHRNLRFVYISANRFLTEYVEAIKRNERFQFQSCFRGVDVLLI
ncbi:MAG: DnaA/Hda family protein, partial [bacterium]